MANEHGRLWDLYHDLGLYDEAIEEYRKALRLRPTFVAIITKIGISLREKGEFDQAVGEFSKAKEANPQYMPARINLGITYYMRGFTGMAVEEWQAALEMDPASAEVKRYLSFVRNEPMTEPSAPTKPGTPPSP
ncbi:MAG: tetratricopeptide repeat protein [Nitrospirae bacterium]|nr:tetratricopeptide repeat protein [Nitrospirota bacterium]